MNYLFFLQLLMVPSSLYIQILDKEAVEEVKAQREIPDIKPGYIIQLKVVCSLILWHIFASSKCKNMVNCCINSFHKLCTISY